MNMEGQRLLEAIRVDRIDGPVPEYIKAVEVDSRKVKEGSLFVCIDGYTVDGHTFAQKAADQGAVAILAEKPIDVTGATVIYVQSTERELQRLAPTFFEQPSRRMTMIGVTGTNGKTTVSHIITTLLATLGERTASMGTIGFTVENELYETDNTTPNVLETQKLIRQAADASVDTMTMEVSSHGLVEGRLAGTEFDIAIFTNLSWDHLDFHKTMEHYGYAKGLLFAQLGQRVDERKFAILNADDEWSERYAWMTPHRVVTYSLQAPSHFKGTILDMDASHTTFRMETPVGSYTVRTELVGDFNVLNLLAAVAALYAKGYELERIIPALETLKPAKGRMERVETDMPVTMYIDYAHTPDAIEKAIAAIEPYKDEKQRLLFLVGTGGNRDREKRPVMAEKASAADYVVLTTDDPRYESYDTILEELGRGMTHDRFALIGDREEAVRHIVQQANEGDIIIFAGKGHEDYQIIENTKYPHSDAVIAIDEAEKKWK